MGYFRIGVGNVACCSINPITRNVTSIYWATPNTRQHWKRKYTSMALAMSNRPHISYYDESNGDLKYAYYNGSTWITETVDSAGDVGKTTSLVLDTFGRPHITYSDKTNYALKYARFDGTGWLTETVNNAGIVNDDYGVSLALDSSGYPHISLPDILFQRGLRPR
jgi:hypothetical protein